MALRNERSQLGEVFKKFRGSSYEFLNVPLSIFRCQENVQITLDCGHSVMLECWEKDLRDITCLKQKCRKKMDASKLDSSTGSTSAHGFLSRMLKPF